MITHATFFDFGFTPAKPSEAIGKLVCADHAPDTYWHNVASYRQSPKWRKVTRAEFHALMRLPMKGAQ